MEQAETDAAPLQASNGHQEKSHSKPEDSSPPSRRDENDRKRKRFGDHKGRHGRGGKKRDLGRNEYEREKVDKRQRTEESRQKRIANPSSQPSVLPAAFAEEEIAAEDRRPKKKVAVLIGYSGTGYKGMQISTTDKTIEGELFTAFVKAGAISKANADDPKKSSLVRCARTDKGVHAAGNMISLKLIVEDEDIIQRINDNLPTQIRVWGIERTTNGFSCYQACDSRWYEYLLPTHTLLPSHPNSFLAKKIEEAAEEVGDLEEVRARQKEVANFWEQVETNNVKPLLAELDPDVRSVMERSLYPDWDEVLRSRSGKDDDWIRNVADMGSRAKPEREDPNKNKKKKDRRDAGEEDEVDEGEEVDPPPETEQDLEQADSKFDPDRKDAILAASKRVKQIYDEARRAYRIDPVRIQRLQDTLSAYVGTPKFHNYTIQKSFNDPSARRTIRSFAVNPEPILINGTEWLSLKVHGQSFMMHQIRKMVGMAVLLVRSGADGPRRIKESYSNQQWAIPKVPGLGLLLERPVFHTYNSGVAPKFGREKLDFGKFEKQIDEFKRKEIYERIFEKEKEENTFHQFFNHIDNYAMPHFLYLTSKGWEATQVPLIKKEESDVQ